MENYFQVSENNKLIILQAVKLRIFKGNIKRLNEAQNLTNNG